MLSNLLFFRSHQAVLERLRGWQQSFSIGIKGFMNYFEFSGRLAGIFAVLIGDFLSIALHIEVLVNLPKLDIMPPLRLNCSKDISIRFIFSRWL